MESRISPKSRLAVVLLAWFFGSLGFHRFYIGKISSGIVILLLGIVGWSTTWLLGFGYIFLILAGIWVLIDFLTALFGTMKDGSGRPITRW